MKASRKSGVAGTIPFNNAAERALRGLALGRKSWLFAGSERGAERAAIMYTLIQTAKLNEIDPQAWLADTLSKIAETPQTRLGKLLPWNWMSDRMSASISRSRNSMPRNRNPLRRRSRCRSIRAADDERGSSFVAGDSSTVPGS